MPGIQWTLVYPWALSTLVRHAWDTVDLVYPWALSTLVRHDWDTVDLVYPWALSTLVRHGWDTVDPGPIQRSYKREFDYRLS